MKTLILIVSCLLIASSVIFSQANREEGKAGNSKAERLIYQAEHEFMKTRDPKTDALPDNIKERELKFVSKIPIIEEYYSMQKVGKTEPRIQTQSWKQRGPWNCGGRFLCIAFDAENEQIINAGAASGGMWHSIDGGASWVKTTPSNAIQSVGCVVQDKRQGKTNTWYYGTGELLSTVDRKFSSRIRMLSIGNGIYKSSDNGASWEIIKSTEFNYRAGLVNPFQGVWNIVVDNTNKNQDIIYAACFGGIMRSTDGGENWVNVLGDSTNMPFSSEIVMTSKGDLYAAISKMSITGKAPAKYGIFRSVDGITWLNITPKGFPDTTRVIRMALAPSNENILYLVAEKPPSSKDYISFSTATHYFWKYTDNKEPAGSGSWENRTDNLPRQSTEMLGFNTLGAYCMTLKVNPDNENVVFLGGTCLYRSTNGFKDSNSTVQIGGYFNYGGWDMTNQYCHPDIHGLAFLPSNPNSLFVANDGGIHKTDSSMNEKVPWKPLNNGLLGSQFYSVSIDHASNDDFVFGGLQDNASMYSFSGDLKSDWTSVIGGDGMSSCVADNKEFIVGSWQWGGIISYRFDKDKNPIDLFYQLPDTINSSNFDFFTSFVLDPNDNSTFYLPAKNKIWRKAGMKTASKESALKNVGWKELTKGQLPPGESITSIAISKAPANRLYFGTGKGNVYRIDNANTGNPLLYKINSPEFPENGFVACVAIDPHDADNIFAIFSNYNVQSIFHSTNGGNSWRTEGGNLENFPDGSGSGPSVRWLKILHTSDGPLYYAGTTTGVYSTFELAGTHTVWMQEASAIMGNMIVDMIDARESDGTLVVATQGGGVYSTKVIYSSAPDTKDEKFSISLEQNYPNPAKNQTMLKFSLEKPGLVSLRLYDVNGLEIKNIAEGFYTSGIHNMIINTSNLLPGAYFYRLSTENGVSTRKMVVTR